MREIKFRGKDTLEGNWYIGSYMFTNDNTNNPFRSGPFKESHRIIFYSSCDWNMGGWNDVEIDPSTLGQYTGLKDKNGNEIYEGDILRVEEFKNESDSMEKSEEFYEVFDLEDMKGKKRREYITPVRWEDGAFVISARQENDTFLCVLYGDMRMSFPIFIFEVIGNIYDNPELINKEYLV